MYLLHEYENDWSIWSFWERKKETERLQASQISTDPAHDRIWTLARLFSWTLRSDAHFVFFYSFRCHDEGKNRSCFTFLQKNISLPGQEHDEDLFYLSYFQNDHFPWAGNQTNSWSCCCLIKFTFLPEWNLETEIIQELPPPPAYLLQNSGKIFAQFIAWFESFSQL